MLTELVVLVALLYAVYRYIRYYNSFLRHIKKLPSVPGHWLLGNIGPDQINDTYKTAEFLIRETVKREGCFVLWMGHFPIVRLNDPDDHATILRGTESQKNYIYDFLHPWMGLGLLTSWGPQWKRARRMITPAFHFNVLQDYVEIFVRHANALCDRFGKELKNGELEIDVQNEMTYVSLDNIGECAFGVDFDSVNNPKHPFVLATIKASACLMERFVNPLYMNDFLYNVLPAGRRNREALSVLHEFSANAIRKREQDLAQGKPLKDKYFLDILLSATDSDGSTLSFKQIQDEVDTFMFEGHDTTSCGLMWTLFDIAGNPEVEKKVMAELREVLPKDLSQITYDTMQKLNYLSMVIKESHRIHPPVPDIGRKTDRPLTLKYDRFLPEGTTVMLSAITLGRNPRFFEDPDKFDPERFNSENSANRHPFVYLPFSAGPRNCIGQNFAFLEEKVVLSVLLSRYAFSKNPRTLERIKGEMVLRNEGPLYMTVKPRK